MDSLYQVQNISMNFPRTPRPSLAGAAAPYRVELTTAVTHLATNFFEFRFIYVVVRISTVVECLGV